MTERRIALLVASPRPASLNLKLSKAIVKHAPDGLRFERVEMADMPFYNADLESDRPASARRFTDAIAAADAVCIVTPEYNRSIPAVLKNAIDWGSKPPAENVWRDKVVAMTGTSPGKIGTAIAQQHLRQILSILGAYVMPGETYISFSPADLIDDEGNVKDDGVRDFIAAFATRFAALVERMA
jgi:chromate reductase, NAD(P)H dehydrogenase (quinone)